MSSTTPGSGLGCQAIVSLEEFETGLAEFLIAPLFQFSGLVEDVVHACKAELQTADVSKVSMLHAPLCRVEVHEQRCIGNLAEIPCNPGFCAAIGVQVSRR